MSMFDQLVALFTQHGARFRVIQHPAEGRSDLTVAAIRVGEDLTTSSCPGAETLSAKRGVAAGGSSGEIPPMFGW